MHPREVAIIGAMALFVLVPWVMVRSMWRRPASAWAAARRSRWVWTAIVVLVPVMGAVWYVRVVRPEVQAAAARERRRR